METAENKEAVGHDEIDDGKNAEELLAAENRLLEMVAKGNPLASILDAACRYVESANDSLCSILVVDSNSRLRHAAAPSLPPDYIRWVDGRDVGLQEGPCASAAFSREQVIALVLGSDTRLPESYRTVASAHGLRACWFTPIVSQAGTVLGTFALYFREPASPTMKLQNLIEQFTHIASIAIERTQSSDALRQNEQELRQIVEAVPLLIIVMGPDGRYLYANRRVLEYTGLAQEDVAAGDFRERVFHPEDVERLREERRQAFARGVPFEAEQRARRKDGEYRRVLTRVSRLRNQQGNL